MTALISRSELQAAVAERSVVLVDALPRSPWAQQHLPAALNRVEQDVAARAAELLPDKDAAIVTHCSNAACGNSQGRREPPPAAPLPDVRKYREGVQDWVESGLPVETDVVTS